MSALALAHTLVDRWVDLRIIASDLEGHKLLGDESSSVPDGGWGLVIGHDDTSGGAEGFLGGSKIGR